jgi:hypothetical protein
MPIPIAKILLKGLMWAGLALAISGCAYAPAPYAYDTYYGYPAYYDYAPYYGPYYYGPTVYFSGGWYGGRWGRWHHGYWH